MAQEIPTLEELIRRVKVVLFEMGYEDIVVVGTAAEDALNPGWPTFSMDRPLPPAVHWMAAYLTVPNVPCWSCWRQGWETHQADVILDCAGGKCHHPEGPHRPPRELLQPRRTS